MIDYTLKFPDEATAAEVLEPFVTTHRIDVIGIIYKKTGKMLSSVEGEYPETKPVAGWHVNLRGPDADKFPSYEVTVNTPSRNWF